MRPHLSAEELGVLLGRTTLTALPVAAWRDPEPVPARGVAPVRAVAEAQPAWTAALAPGRADAVGIKG